MTSADVASLYLYTKAGNLVQHGVNVNVVDVMVNAARLDVPLSSIAPPLLQDET